MEVPFQARDPAAGGSRPQTILSRLVLPLPLGPLTWSRPPLESSKASPANSRRSPRTQSSPVARNVAVGWDVMRLSLRF